MTPTLARRSQGNAGGGGGGDGRDTRDERYEREREREKRGREGEQGWPCCWRTLCMRYASAHQVEEGERRGRIVGWFRRLADGGGCDGGGSSCCRRGLSAQEGKEGVACRIGSSTFLRHCDVVVRVVIISSPSSSSFSSSSPSPSHLLSGMSLHRSNRLRRSFLVLPIPLASVVPLLSPSYSVLRLVLTRFLILARYYFPFPRSIFVSFVCIRTISEDTISPSTRSLTHVRSLSHFLFPPR